MAMFGRSWLEDEQNDEYYGAYHDGKSAERKSVIEEVQRIINKSKDLTHDQKIKLWEEVDRLKYR